MAGQAKASLRSPPSGDPSPVAPGPVPGGTVIEMTASTGLAATYGVNPPSVAPGPVPGEPWSPLSPAQGWPLLQAAARPS